MKFLLLISILFSLAFSYNTRIVIGCFKEEQNAKNEKININYIIRHDKKFQTFLEINSINTTYKLIDSFYVLSFEPFSDSAVRKAVYNKIKERYPDAYIIPITPEDEIEQSSQIKIPEKQEKVAEAVKDEPMVQEETIKDVEKNNSAQSDPLLASEPKAEDLKIPKYDELKTKQSMVETSVVEKKKTKITPAKQSPKEDSGSIVNYLIEIILFIVVVIAILVYFLRKNSQQMNENELFHNSANSSLENIVINEIDPNQENPYEDESGNDEEDIEEYENDEDQKDDSVVFVEDNSEAIDLSNIESEQEEASSEETASEEITEKEDTEIKKD